MRALSFSLALLPACAVAGGDRYERQLSVFREEEPRIAEELGDAELFGNAPALEREALVASVLARNPTIDAARHAWRAALAGFPQTTALADPMASYMFAPLSIVGPVAFGQEVMLSQSFPFPGKLEQRGAAALADADAMRSELDAVRLELSLMASMLHADYFKNAQQLTVNDEHRALVTTMRGALQGRFEAGEESLQGPLGAELELVQIEQDRVQLLSERDVISARINELLHRPPASPLPPPPSALEMGGVVEKTPDELMEEAVAQRPELVSLRARIKAADAESALAQAESWPDFSVRASYNSMWSDVPHQFMIGGSVDIPIQLGRRAAAVQQAESTRRQRDAELTAQLDTVRAEVESERRRAIEARHVLRLFDERKLPVAEAVVDAARAGLETGRTSFLELLDAERALRTAKLDRAAAVAVLHQQAARLERALGRSPVVTTRGEQP